MGPRSSPLSVHLNRILPHAIYNDLAITRGAEILADKMMTESILNILCGTATTPSNRGASSLHLHNSDGDVVVALGRNRFGQWASLREPFMCHALSFTEN
jgi:hypothetical protein